MEFGIGNFTIWNLQFGIVGGIWKWNLESGILEFDFNEAEAGVAVTCNHCWRQAAFFYPRSRANMGEGTAV